MFDCRHVIARCRWLPVIILLALAVLIPETASAQPPSPLSPASTEAKTIADLFTVVFWVALGVFVIVEGLLVYSVIRFRRRHPDEGMPVQIHGSTPVEVAWTIAPAIIVAVILLLTLRSMRTLYTPPSGTINVEVIGHQWWWEFRYPDLGIITANELHIPVGEPVSLKVEAADVIHSFWVPELGGKTDAIPGHTNQAWIQATQAGVYKGQCAEFCGTEHALMRLEVIASPSEQFQQWVQGQQAPPAVPSGAAARGQQALVTGPCAGCHTIQGTAAQGQVGPNLTHFASRRTFAGASLENTPENLARWLNDPPALKPGTLMPRLGLSQETINDLVAYLESLK